MRVAFATRILHYDSMTERQKMDNKMRICIFIETEQGVAAFELTEGTMTLDNKYAGLWRGHWELEGKHINLDGDLGRAQYTDKMPMPAKPEPETKFFEGEIKLLKINGEDRTPIAKKEGE
jgi:hypothetical protein